MDSECELLLYLVHFATSVLGPVQESTPECDLKAGDCWSSVEMVENMLHSMFRLYCCIPLRALHRKGVPNPRSAFPGL